MKESNNEILYEITVTLALNSYFARILKQLTYDEDRNPYQGTINNKQSSILILEELLLEL